MIRANRFARIALRIARATKAYMKKLHFLDLEVNKLSSSIPEAMGTWKSLFNLELNENKLSGMLPASSASMTLLYNLGLTATGLSGTILPIASMPDIRSILLQFNRFSGSIPSGMACLSDLQCIFLDENHISGTITDVLRLTDMIELTLPFNNLSGILPAAPMRAMENFNLNHNSLSGTISHALLSLRDAYIGLTRNKLSGTLQVAISSRVVFISGNRLTGSLPRLTWTVVVLVCRGNLLEGTVPPVAALKRLQIFDVSGRPGERRGLEGPLPMGLRRTTKLGHLLLAHQKLDCMSDQLSTATLSSLSLHNNGLKVMLHVHLKEDGEAVVLLHNNDLSCHLPTFGRASARFSLSAPGNHMQRPLGGFPAWVLPLVALNRRFWIENRAILNRAIRIVRFHVLNVATSWRSFSLNPSRLWKMCPASRKLPWDCRMLQLSTKGPECMLELTQISQTQIADLSPTNVENGVTQCVQSLQNRWSSRFLKFPTVAEA